VLLLLLQMAATLEEIREKNRQLAESNLSKQNAINEVRHSTGHRLL
jgi:FtsZ-binding cell division protein ZapB